MAKKRRECPKPGKKKFGVEDDAAAAALRLLRDRGEVQYIYECDCGSWHLTKQRQETVLSVPLPTAREAQQIWANRLSVSVGMLAEMSIDKLRRLLVGGDDS